MQQTVLRSTGNVFQISAPTYIRKLFHFSNTNFLSPQRVHLQHWVPSHLGFPPPFIQSPLLTLSLQKTRLSIACQHTHQLTRGLIFKGLSKKASMEYQTTGDAVAGDRSAFVRGHHSLSEKWLRGAGSLLSLVPAICAFLQATSCSSQSPMTSSSPNYCVEKRYFKPKRFLCGIHERPFSLNSVAVAWDLLLVTFLSASKFPPCSFVCFPNSQLEYRYNHWIFPTVQTY